MGVGAAAASVGSFLASNAAVIGAGTALVGTGVSVYGAIQQGEAQKQAADYQAQVARNNQIVAQQNAAAVKNQAAAKAQDTQRAGDIRLSAQRAALGANGGTLDSGSALGVQQSTAEATQMGVDRDQAQGALAAYGYAAQGTNYGAQAGLDTMKGDNAQAASFTTAASSFLGGASQVSSKWAVYQQGGQPDWSKTAFSGGAAP